MPTREKNVEAAAKKAVPGILVEGFAVRLEASAEVVEVVARLRLKVDGSWVPSPGGWLVHRIPAGQMPPPLGLAWERVAQLLDEPGIAAAEPLLLVEVPKPSATESQRLFGVWGWVSSERRGQIAAASKNSYWALEQLRVTIPSGAKNGEAGKGAWSIWQEAQPGKEPGDGIRIAQIDTGYTPHPRILPNLELNLQKKIGLSFVGDENEGDRLAGALDPLPRRLPLLSSPGHGTKVASVIAADRQAAGRPWGVAPGAKILPMRVSKSVIHFSFDNVCDAFDAAIEARVDIISMSLGGPIASERLQDRVDAALAAGIIVVAAAGNDIPGVVFPARLPGVIACAASNALEAPWRGSGLGEEVVITAPGEQVWHEEPIATGKDENDPLPAAKQGNGTSYAAAHTAGLAALWLSYHGRGNLLAACDGKKSLLPFLFRLCLKASADRPTELEGFGFGAGLARADALLRQSLPTLEGIEKERQAIEGEKKGTFLSLQSWRKLMGLPTLTAEMPEPTRVSNDAGQAQLEAFLTSKQGLLPAGLTTTELAELAAWVGIDLQLANALARVVASARHWVTPAAVRRYLLKRKDQLSVGLANKLEEAQSAAAQTWLAALPPEAQSLQRKMLPVPPDVAPPRHRRLRVFAFDPSLQTSSAEFTINEITLPVIFENELLPGPVGDYLEVVDVDPASGCAYAPVDLNHPWLLAQDGIGRSEGNPQFHQQMVYAVAMTTIRHFEEALGRPIFWSPLRPWDESGTDKDRAAPRKKRNGEPVLADQFVRRLRLYPHALRAQNAYYSPEKRAILFGYFPAGDNDPGNEYPGGLVFTCLAYDIIAHEMTHAILDGMHYRYIEPTNPDVYAFHEAFADIVALFQRFTFRELLEDQIAKSRGRLDSSTLMTQLALQFGRASGRHHALRDAIGHIIRQGQSPQRKKWHDLANTSANGGDGSERETISVTAFTFGEAMRLQWKRFRADPSVLGRVYEPHERGSFLVAAVFDAFLTIYEARIADLQRIATGGTGILPDGDLHPDLVRRMAREATLAARHVLNICIRAMDYVPPTDITFGEYLRALITADSDLVPDDTRHYRVAFIEAFRKWGIYPRDVRTLSEESLRWSSPPKATFKIPLALDQLRGALMKWQPGESRLAIFWAILKAQAALHDWLENLPEGEQREALLAGIDTKTKSFQVSNLRPARRIGPSGEFLTEMVVEILQSKAEVSEGAKQKYPFRGGATLIIGFEKDKFRVRYAIYKRLDSNSREARQQEFLGASNGDSGAAEYSSQGLPNGWYSDPQVREAWRMGRNLRSEDMRASSAACRRSRMEGKKPTTEDEPFALLHRR